MLNIDPDDFEFPVPLLRKVMKLSENAKIIPNGYEKKYPDDIKIKIQKHYDYASLIIRGEPDFQVYDIDKFFLVEGKSDLRAVEAIPLLLNKIYSKKSGIPVYYCTPDYFIHAKDVSLEPSNGRILVPLTHADDFKKYFESWFIEYGVKKTNIRYLENPSGGSGDPFVLNEDIERKKLEGFDAK